MPSTPHRLGEVIRHPTLLLRRVKWLGAARIAAKQAVDRASRAVWRVPLDRDNTVGMLNDYVVQVSRDGVVNFPQPATVAGEPPAPLGGYEIPLEPEYVWRLARDETIRSMRITSSGTILLNHRLLLDTDFGSLAGIRELPLKKRRRVRVDTAIAPWSHKWATYYEFVFHVLAKLCRIKGAIDSSTWNASSVCYPRLNLSFEREYLSLLGLDEGSLVDTRTNVDVQARTIVISNNQGSHSRLPSPASIAGLRGALLGEAHESVRSGRRLYLSRVGWKRQVLNETEVRRLVSSLDFEVVETIPPSVREQIRMFSEASLIVSPHGSALTNLVWCATGTRVVELFSRSFTPPMYAYISHVLGLDYSCLADAASGEHHWTNMHKDMHVNMRSLATAIENAGHV
jgi:hypothetical protein